MRFGQLAGMALKHVRNAFAEELYLRTHKDITRPVVVYGMVNEWCNYKCRYCEYWRLPNYREEMSIEEWQDALGSLKDFIGPYHIEFSGGEPYIKKGFLDLLRFCRDRGINWGVTTNGSAFTEKIVRETVTAQPFNVNMSMDSNRSEVHDYARGIDGSLDRITNGLKMLLAERDRQGQSFPVIVKPVVHKLNFRHLPEMVSWVQELGATAINFQPIDRWTKETYEELWIEEPDMPELMAVRDQLLKMKKAGAPILNSELLLSVWPEHFRGEKAPPDTMPCRVGLRNYFIRCDGQVEVCWFYPPIGNVKTQSAREIWYGQEATKRRDETTACESLCLFTCLSQKTIKDKVKMGLTLLKGERGKKRGKTAVALPVVS
jgi:MoaA/NifB/PqqE/SkfB family radical SAM enzyme